MLGRCHGHLPHHSSPTAVSVDSEAALLYKSGILSSLHCETQNSPAGQEGSKTAPPSPPSHDLLMSPWLVKEDPSMPSRQSVHAPDVTQALGGKIDVLPQTQHIAKDSAEAGIYDNTDLNIWSAGSLPVMMGNCRKSDKIRPFLSLMPLVLTMPVSLCVCGYVDLRLHTMKHSINIKP